MRHQNILFQYFNIQDNSISVFFYYRVLNFNFERKKAPKNPGKKTPTIVSSCKGFTDSNDLFCCCPTSLLVFLKIIRLRFMKCFQSPPCRSGHRAVNLVVGQLLIYRVAKVSELTGWSVFLRSGCTSCTPGRRAGRGSQEWFTSRS